MIYLRPHHLLCTQGYSGKGYDENFVAHMNEVVHELRNVPGTRIMLTFSTDTLCSCCPHKEGEDLCDTQEKVKRFDRKTIEYFGLEEKEYVYQDLIREIDEKMTSEMLADICRDCEWFPISACRSASPFSSFAAARSSLTCSAVRARFGRRYTSCVLT